MEPQFKRKSNYSERDKIILIEEYRSREHILKPRLGSSVSAQDKDRAWQEITDKINATNPTILRSKADIKKKWNNMNTNMKANLYGEKRHAEKTGGGGPQSLMTEVDHALLAIAGEDSPAIIGICGGADSLQNLERCDDPVRNTGKKHSVPTTAGTSTASTSGCLEKMTKKKLYDCYLEVEIKRSKLEAEKIREETEKIRLEKELLQMQIKIHKNQLDIMNGQEVKSQIFDLLKEPAVKTEILDLTDLPEI